MAFNRTVFLFLLFGILVQGSCSKWEPEAGSYSDSDRAAQLRETLESIAADGFNLVVNPELWIDRMPKTGGETPDMNGVITLEDRGGKNLPEGTSIRRVYLINGEQIFVVFPKPDKKSEESSRVTAHFGDGPNWKDGIRVAVVCQFKLNEKSYLVQNSAVPITAVY